ncbi:hypothetical protein [Paraburkholderia sp. XV]|uniref:hypothetical protein n=1 Tax=Paraburkholderia sp. XV TaxID=2831520 RepID=UPI001CD6930C|nr:hypothetical protein [Paraburkholderia sp. XV]
MLKSFRRGKLAQETLEQRSLAVDFLQLSRLNSEHEPHIHPCKAQKQSVSAKTFAGSATVPAKWMANRATFAPAQEKPSKALAEANEVECAEGGRNTFLR